METLLLVVARREEARPEVLVVHRNIDERVRDSGLKNAVFDEGLGLPADGLTFPLTSLDRRPHQVLHPRFLRSLDDVLPVELLGIVPVLVELGHSEYAPRALESLRRLLQTRQISLDDLDALGREGLGGWRRRVSSNSTDGELSCRLFQEEVNYRRSLSECTDDIWLS